MARVDSLSSQVGMSESEAETTMVSDRHNQRHQGQHEDHEPRTDDGLDLVRHEERAVARTETFVREVVRVTKRIVTETVTVEVPVRREELIIERLPGAGRPVTENPADREAEQEIIVYAERPVVTTELVPVERVRLAIEVQEARFSDDVELAKEVLDIDGVVPDTQA